MDSTIGADDDLFFAVCFKKERGRPGDSGFALVVPNRLAIRLVARDALDPPFYSQDRPAE